MAKSSFRQGILSYGKAPSQVFFLQVNGDYIDLVVSPSTTIITFTDGVKDYLYTEFQTTLEAWGTFTVPTNSYWLYWDLNKVTGIRTFGSTLLAPIYAATEPVSPIITQMWFDTSVGNTTSNKMFEYNGSTWTPVLRVFAGKYLNNIFYSPIGGLATDPNLFGGTQIGATGNVTSFIGALAYDANGKPIMTQDGQFFTTEDSFTTGVPTGASIKTNELILTAISSANIAAYQVVIFDSYNKVSPAVSADFLDTIHGIVEEDVIMNDMTNVITRGVVTNTAWDFSDATNNPNMSGDVNTVLYITSGGDLTTNKALAIAGQVAMGVVLDVDTILFQPGIFNFEGVATSGASGDHGTLTGLADDDHPQYLNISRGDARYPILSHTHVEANITDLDKYTQAEVDALIGAGAGITHERALTQPGNLAILIGTARWYPADDVTLVDIHCSVGIPSSGQDIIVDVKKNGVSILPSTVTITSGVNLVAAVVPTDTTLLTTDYITIDTLQIGTFVKGSDLLVNFKYS